MEEYTAFLKWLKKKSRALATSASFNKILPGNYDYRNYTEYREWLRTDDYKQWQSQAVENPELWTIDTRVDAEGNPVYIQIPILDWQTLTKGGAIGVYDQVYIAPVDGSSPPRKLTRQENLTYKLNLDDLYYDALIVGMANQLNQAGINVEAPVVEGYITKQADKFLQGQEPDFAQMIETVKRLATDRIFLQDMYNQGELGEDFALDRANQEELQTRLKQKVTEQPLAPLRPQEELAVPQPSVSAEEQLQGGRIIPSGQIKDGMYQGQPIGAQDIVIAPDVETARQLGFNRWVAEQDFNWTEYGNALEGSRLNQIRQAQGGGFREPADVQQSAYAQALGATGYAGKGTPGFGNIAADISKWGKTTKSDEQLALEQVQQERAKLERKQVQDQSESEWRKLVREASRRSERFIRL